HGVRREVRREGRNAKAELREIDGINTASAVDDVKATGIVNPVVARPGADHVVPAIADDRVRELRPDNILDRVKVRDMDDRNACYSCKQLDVIRVADAVG